MPNYNESTLAGTSWQRCKAMYISNPLDPQPGLDGKIMGAYASFDEEQVVLLDTGEKFKRSVGSFAVEFDPVSGQFPVLNPETGVPTGSTITHQELYAILYSLYIDSATKRDLANQQQVV